MANLTDGQENFDSDMMSEEDIAGDSLSKGGVSDCSLTGFKYS